MDVRSIVRVVPETKEVLGSYSYLTLHVVVEVFSASYFIDLLSSGIPSSDSQFSSLEVISPLGDIRSPELNGNFSSAVKTDVLVVSFRKSSISLNRSIYQVSSGVFSYQLESFKIIDSIFSGDSASDSDSINRKSTGGAVEVFSERTGGQVGFISEEVSLLGGVYSVVVRVGTTLSSLSGISISNLLKKEFRNGVVVLSSVVISQRIFGSSVKVRVEKFLVSTLLFIHKIPVFFSKDGFNEFQILVDDHSLVRSLSKSGDRSINFNSDVLNTENGLKLKNEFVTDHVLVTLGLVFLES